MVTDLRIARICTPLCTVKEAPEASAPASSELLFGELVEVSELHDDYATIRVTTDGYEGYVTTDSLIAGYYEATHSVNTRATFIFEKPDIKSTILHRVLFGSQLALSPCGTHENFMGFLDQGFVWADHCRTVDQRLESSLIDIADQHYMNAPYLWGGRSPDGCDCSGLVQMLAASRGINIPRDSGDQEIALTTDISFENRAPDQLVYWPGHVGVLKTEDTLLHSTAHSMKCCLEPLHRVIERAGPPSSVKQLVPK